jgi:CRP-like cAMP-binding protein
VESFGKILGLGEEDAEDDVEGLMVPVSLQEIIPIIRRRPAKYFIAKKYGFSGCTPKTWGLVNFEKQFPEMLHEKEFLQQFFENTGKVNAIKAREIAECFEEKTIGKGKLFLKEGQVSNEYMVLQKGFMRSYSFDLNGTEVTTAFHNNGYPVFEVASFFNRTSSKENIQALSDCHGWIITYEQLNLLFHSIVEFREFGRSILVKGFAGLKTRMLSLITETAEERYVSLLELTPEIFQYAPLKQIASYLGITDSSLSRIRKEMMKK